MRLRVALIATGIALLALPTIAEAANTRDSVTGGGQSFFDGREPTGAGDTVAFVAQRAKNAPEGSEDATGQIQVKRRGTNAIKFHGTFDCLNVSGIPGSGGGYAYMHGMSRATKTQPAMPFELYVSDGGTGQNEQSDMIMLFVGDETTANDSDNEDANDVCGFEDFDPAADSIEMFRGNVQVRNRNESEDDDPDAGTDSQGASTQAVSSLLSL